MEEQEAKKYFSAMLSEIGVGYSLQGFIFIREIAWVMYNKYYTHKRIPTLLAIEGNVAEAYETTISRLERNCRTAITKSCEKCDLKTWNDLFGNTMKCGHVPCLRDFVCRLAFSLYEKDWFFERIDAIVTQSH